MIVGIDPYVAGWLDLDLPLVPRHRRDRLDRHLVLLRRARPAPARAARGRDRERGVGGESWEIHGGGFYRIEKFRVAPPQLPKPLHWYKWEAYWTWLPASRCSSSSTTSRPDTNLIDPSVADLATWEAIADLASAASPSRWLVYDALCRTIGQTERAALAVCVARRS